jgi:crotonobetainyl-CoA:carnitine CoA-transferase CaiB-like acyl-CoA transferase
LQLSVEPTEETPERSHRLAKLVTEAETVMASRTTADWLERFIEARIPAGPLRFPEEVFTDEQVAANGYLTRLEHPIAGTYSTVAPPVRMTESPLAAQGTAPTFGEHTRAVLAAAGYAPDEIETLVSGGVVAAK